MDNKQIDRSVVAEKIAELVALADTKGVSIPARFGFLLGELQGLEITLRHGSCGVPGAAERFAHICKPAEVR